MKYGNPYALFRCRFCKTGQRPFYFFDDLLTAFYAMTLFQILRVVVAQPDRPLAVLPDQRLLRQIDGHTLGTLHQRCPHLRVAKNHNLGWAQFQPNLTWMLHTPLTKTLPVGLADSYASMRLEVASAYTLIFFILIVPVLILMQALTNRRF